MSSSSSCVPPPSCLGTKETGLRREKLFVGRLACPSAPRKSTPNEAINRAAHFGESLVTSAQRTCKRPTDRRQRRPVLARAAHCAMVHASTSRTPRRSRWRNRIRRVDRGRVTSPKVSFGRRHATSRRSGALEHQPSDRRRLTTAPVLSRRGPGFVKIPVVASAKRRRRRRLVSAAILCRSAEGSKGTVVNAATLSHRVPKTRRSSRLTPQI